MSRESTLKRAMRLSMRRRETLTGIFFVAPFVVGTLVFFLYPLITSFLLGFGGTDPTRGGFHLLLTGLENYKRAFQEDVIFVPRLISVAENTLINAPLIVIFSLILAIMLNKLTLMKGFFRVVVLLPFLLGTGEVMKQLLAQGVDTQILSLSESSIIPREFLDYLGEDFVSALELLFGRIIQVLWSGGVQTLLFLSAIQNIAESLYESARIDGANEYEMFWKITLPMVSPILLLNTIYTIITSFTDVNNTVLDYIQEQMTRYADHGYAAALGWIYFIFILLLLLIVGLLLGRYVRNNQTRGGKIA